MMKFNGHEDREITFEPSEEKSFTTAEEGIIEPAKEAITDTVEKIGEVAGDVTGGIWDSIKWWVIGGVAVLAVVIIASVYVNARARNAAVASTQA